MPTTPLSIAAARPSPWQAARGPSPPASEAGSPMHSGRRSGRVHISAGNAVLAPGPRVTGPASQAPVVRGPLADRGAGTGDRRDSTTTGGTVGASSGVGSSPTASASSTATHTAGLDAPFPGARVLFADDERLIRKLTSHTLSRLGCDVETVTDGDEVLPRLLRARDSGSPFHFVMLDIVMVRQNGDAACRALRADGFRIPVFAVTANTEEQDLAQYADAGFDQVLAKPCGASDFKEAMRSHSTGRDHSGRAAAAAHG